MRVRCIHGYFIFEEAQIGQVSDFIGYSGFSIVAKDASYTFFDLRNAPTHSIAGKMMMGIPAVTTFEGKPWEVFGANRVVYDFTRAMLLPIDSITYTTDLIAVGNRFMARGLIVPGSLTRDGKKIKGFDAWFSRDRLSFLYTGVEYV